MMRWTGWALASVGVLVVGGCSTGSARIVTQPGAIPGWQRVSVTTGDFSVELPEGNVQLRATGNTRTDFGPASQIRISLPQMGSHEHVAMETNYRNPNATSNPGVFLSNATSALEPKAVKMHKESDLTIADSPARTLEYTDEVGQYVFQRLVVRNGKLYQVIVSYLDPNISDEERQHAYRVLDSLRFDDAIAK